MKRYFIFTFLLALLFSCGKERPANTYTIEGETDAPNGLVCVFGTDNRYESIDSVRCDDEGHFSLSMQIDTLTPLFLATPARLSI